MKPGAIAAASPDHLRATINLLQCAFPRGLAPEAYLPLLALLGEQLSDRNLAEVVLRAFGMEYERALNDIYRARSAESPSPEAVEKIKQSLVPYGFENWSRER